LKKCAECESILSATAEQFFCDKGTRDGFVAKCKRCKSGQFKEWLEEGDNKERVYAENAERNRERYANDKQWREDRLAYFDWYRAVNRDKIRSYQREYKQRPDVKLRERIHAHTRRELIRQSEESFTAEDVMQHMEDQGGLCFYCLKPLDEWTIDHKLPISRFGSNSSNNICIACPNCNYRKGAKTVEEFGRHVE
jgi:5-methylcytosine-specific restriction endonuclease McrA